MTTALPLPRPPEWMRDAACAGLASETVDPWHSETGEVDMVRLAKRICRQCPVRMACWEYGKRLPGNQGIWGGHSIRAGVEWGAE